MTQHTSEAAADGARTPSAIDALAERYVTDLLALHPDTATHQLIGRRFAAIAADLGWSVAG